MKKLILIFVSNFFMVFLLGFQTLNVVHDQYISAAVVSSLISVCYYTLLKLIPKGSASIAEFLSLALGGSIGIVLSMYIHHLVPHLK